MKLLPQISWQSILITSTFPCLQKRIFSAKTKRATFSFNLGEIKDSLSFPLLKVVHNGVLEEMKPAEK